MPGKRVDRSAKKGNGRGVVALMAAILFSVLLGSSVYVLVRGGDDGDAGQPSGSDETDTGTGTSGDESAGQLDARLTSCAAEVSSAGRVVAAAQAGVRHWTIHTQARTDMLKGRISEVRMKALWKRTRLAGPTDQRRFQTALRQYDDTSSCAELHELAADSTQNAMAGCVTRADAATKAVSAANGAMGDWKAHLDNMAAFDRGAMTAAKAQKEWVAAWRRAPKNINAYDAARKALAKAPTCTDDAG